MKKYLFKTIMITVIVKADNAFMASDYANQYMEKQNLNKRFETSDAIELDNDMDFGVILVQKGEHLEFFDSENLFYK